MSALTTIDSSALSTVTGGGKKQPPAPSYPNCRMFCGTTVTGVKTKDISIDSHAKTNTNETTNGVKATATVPLLAGGGGVE